MTMTKGEVFIAKITSAQFWMAIMTTTGATLLTFYCVKKFPHLAQVVLTSYFNGWMIILVHYFKRDRTTDPRLGQSQTESPAPQTPADTTTQAT